MFIISKKYGTYNADQLYRISVPVWKEDVTLAAAPGTNLFPVADSADDYHKIIEAIRNYDDYVEVK